MRAVQDLERIQKQKLEKAKNEVKEQTRLRLASEKRIKVAREYVEKRKIELGVADKVAGVPTLAIAYQENSVDQMASESFKKRNKAVAFVELNELHEEDRDTKPIAELLKRYSKLWKNIFTKYQNVCFKPIKLKQAKSFDTVQNQILSMAELTKVLKDHDTFPQVINKEELITLVRLVNMRIESQFACQDLQSLTYQGFLTFIIQLALNCFTRPPKDLSGRPTFEQLQALIDTFHYAIKSKNANTMLYEELEIKPSGKDKELIEALSNKLSTEPEYPLPEGYQKVKELRPIAKYSVPQMTADFLGEANTVSIEIIDQLCNELFGLHILEPQISLQQVFRAKPIFQRFIPRPVQSEVLDIIKRAEEDGHSVNSSSKPTKLKPIESERLTSQAQSQRKQVLLEDVINDNQTGEIEAQPETDPFSSNHVQETEPFNTNQQQLSHKTAQSEKRSQRAINIEKKPAQTVPKHKQEEIRLKEISDKLKEQKRAERNRKVKADLERLKQEQQLKQEEGLKQKEELEKEKKAAEKKKEIIRLAKLKGERDKLQKLKQEKEEKKKQEQEEKEQADLEEAERKKEERAEFFRKQKEQLQEHFESKTGQRKEKETQKSENEKLQQNIKNALKEQISKHGQEAKLKMKREQEIASEMNQYLERQEIKNVFDRNEKGLLKLFKYHCKQAKHDLGVELSFRLENLHYKDFSKFCYQTKIIPQYATADDVSSTFRNIVRYFKEKLAEESELKIGIDAGKSAQYIDFSLFKRALVKLVLISKQGSVDSNLDMTLNDEGKMQIQETVISQMREEYRKQVEPSEVVEKDFQIWLAGQDNILKQRIEQYKKQPKLQNIQARKSIRASSVTKQSFVDFEIKNITADHLQALFQFIGIQTSGDIDEKLLEERGLQAINEIDSSLRKNLLGRLNIKQGQPEPLGMTKEVKIDEVKKIDRQDQDDFQRQSEEAEQ